MSILGGSHADSKGQSSSIATEKSKIFDDALFATLDAFEEKKIAYGLIGGVAAYTHGRPRPTQDIDVFVRPEDADNALDILEECGFKTERTFPSWLYKAFKQEVLIDLIFRSEGNLYFDEEMNTHTVVVNYHGRPVRVVSPEDFILIKAAAHKEDGHHHWHDALAALAQSKVDWTYLLLRARKAPRRLLALLVYAQSADIWIPNDVVQKLYKYIFEGGSPEFVTAPPVPEKTPLTMAPEVATVVEADDHYYAAKIRDALAASEKTGALDIDINVKKNTVTVEGQVHSEIERMAILDRVYETVPDLEIENQIRVVKFERPSSVEALR